jgi:hypothetical protein
MKSRQIFGSYMTGMAETYGVTVSKSRAMRSASAGSPMFPVPNRR